MICESVFLEQKITNNLSVTFSAIPRNNEIINYLVDYAHDVYESDKLEQQTDDLKKELQDNNNSIIRTANNLRTKCL